MKGRAYLRSRASSAYFILTSLSNDHKTISYLRVNTLEQFQVQLI